MEATIEQPEVSEKLLIYTNQSEIDKIVQDARIRANVLNEIVSCGLSPDQIKKLTTENSITDFIFNLHLKQNKRMAMEYSSGKRQRSLIEDYILPGNLEDTQRKLLQWLNFPIHRAGDKYQHLKFNNGRYELDSEALEREFILRKLKFYIEGVDVVEWRQLEAFCEHFKAHKIEVGQLRCHFFDTHLEPTGRAEYKPRWTYFNQDRH